MKRILAALLLATFAAPVIAALPVALPPKELPHAAAPEEYKPELPAGAREYRSARFTQNLFENPVGGAPGFVPGYRSRIDPFPIAKMQDARWHQPGGLEGIDRSLWEARKFRTLPEGKEPQRWLGAISAKNGLDRLDAKGNKIEGRQMVRALLRKYPDGTRFDELLVNAKTGKVFEHRVREKVDGEWESDVAYKDEGQRPKGYTGLKVSCASCHDEAGEGKYADGAAPGGDGVLSDPLPWEVWTRTPPETFTAPAPKVEPKAEPKAEPRPLPPSVPQSRAVPFQTPLYYQQGKPNCPT